MADSRDKVQFSFSGGGANFLAHLEVISVFQKNFSSHFDVTRVSGTSAGSIAAAIMALGLPADVVKSLLMQKKPEFDKLGRGAFDTVSKIFGVVFLLSLSYLLFLISPPSLAQLEVDLESFAGGNDTYFLLLASAASGLALVIGLKMSTKPMQWSLARLFTPKSLLARKIKWVLFTSEGDAVRPFSQAIGWNLRHGLAWIDFWAWRSPLLSIWVIAALLSTFVAWMALNGSAPNVLSLALNLEALIGPDTGSQVAASVLASALVGFFAFLVFRVARHVTDCDREGFLIRLCKLLSSGVRFTLVITAFSVVSLAILQAVLRWQLGSREVVLTDPQFFAADTVTLFVFILFVLLFAFAAMTLLGRLSGGGRLERFLLSILRDAIKMTYGAGKYGKEPEGYEAPQENVCQLLVLATDLNTGEAVGNIYSVENLIKVIEGNKKTGKPAYVFQKALVRNLSISSGIPIVFRSLFSSLLDQSPFAPYESHNRKRAEWRFLVDGGFSENLPVRSVIQHHQDKSDGKPLGQLITIELADEFKSLNNTRFKRLKALTTPSLLAGIATAIVETMLRAQRTLIDQLPQVIGRVFIPNEYVRGPLAFKETARLYLSGEGSQSSDLTKWIRSGNSLRDYEFRNEPTVGLQMNIKMRLSSLIFETLDDPNIRSFTRISHAIDPSGQEFGFRNEIFERDSVEDPVRLRNGQTANWMEKGQAIFQNWSMATSAELKSKVMLIDVQQRERGFPDHYLSILTNTLLELRQSAQRFPSAVKVSVIEDLSDIGTTVDGRVGLHDASELRETVFIPSEVKDAVQEGFVGRSFASGYLVQPSLSVDNAAPRPIITHVLQRLTLSDRGAVSRLSFRGLCLRLDKELISAAAGKGNLGRYPSLFVILTKPKRWRLRKWDLTLKQNSGLATVTQLGRSEIKAQLVKDHWDFSTNWDNKNPVLDRVDVFEIHLLPGAKVPDAIVFDVKSVGGIGGRRNGETVKSNWFSRRGK